MLISNGHSYQDILNNYSISQVYAFYDSITRIKNREQHIFLSYLANIVGSATILQISTGSKKSFKNAANQWEKMIKFFNMTVKESFKRTEEDKSEKAKKVLNQLLSLVPAVPVERGTDNDDSRINSSTKS